jgi:hypothetical protein
MALPLVAGVDTVAIGVPDLWPIRGWAILAWPGGGGLGKGERGACQQQPYRNSDPVHGFCVRQISLLALLPTAASIRASGETELYRCSSAGWRRGAKGYPDALPAPCAASVIGNRYRLMVKLIVTK